MLYAERDINLTSPGYDIIEFRRQATGGLLANGVAGLLDLACNSEHPLIGFGLPISNLICKS